MRFFVKTDRNKEQNNRKILFFVKMRIANKDKIVFLPKQFILRHFQFENCVFRSESVAKSDKLSYNKNGRGASSSFSFGEGAAK